MQSKVYGDRPGAFYGEKDVWLWMPKKLVSSANPQLDYIAAHGKGNLYLALTNQSSDRVSTTLTLNGDAAPYEPGRIGAEEPYPSLQPRTGGEDHGGCLVSLRAFRLDH